MVETVVDFAVPVEVAFDYLADPRNRPEWQSSLARVEMLSDGEPRVGMRWRDHTKPGVVPDMEITVLDRPRLWAESGRWRAVRADLTLTFTPMTAGCAVDVTFHVTAPGLLSLVGRLVTLAAARPVRQDVGRAATILAERQAAR